MRNRPRQPGECLPVSALNSGHVGRQVSLFGGKPIELRGVEHKSSDYTTLHLGSNLSTTVNNQALIVMVPTKEVDGL